MARRKPYLKKDLRRRGPKREPYDRVLIVCEGEKTEPNYFRELCSYYKLSVANVVVTPAEGSSPITVVRFSKTRQRLEKKQGEQYDRIYCVFDRDEHTTFRAACEQAATNGFRLATSIPCFEYWLLLHFEATNAPFEHEGGRTAAQNVQRSFKKCMPDYSKGRAGVFNALIQRLDDAKNRAERVLQESERIRSDNPSTRVHHLVDYLQKLKNSEQ